jgi:hypothetical protein
MEPKTIYKIDLINHRHWNSLCKCEVWESWMNKFIGNDCRSRSFSETIFWSLVSNYELGIYGWIFLVNDWMQMKFSEQSNARWGFHGWKQKKGPGEWQNANESCELVIKLWSGDSWMKNPDKWMQMMNSLSNCQVGIHRWKNPIKWLNANDFPEPVHYIHVRWRFMDEKS